jgi:hypothetical protein
MTAFIYAFDGSFVRVVVPPLVLVKVIVFDDSFLYSVAAVAVPEPELFDPDDFAVVFVPAAFAVVLVPDDFAVVFDPDELLAAFVVPAG